MDIRQQVMEEIGDVVVKVAWNQLDSFKNSLTCANHIFILGLGREGLMLKAFAMRLMHLGFPVYVVGDVTTPAIDQGDVLFISSGPGYTSTIITLTQIARKKRAKIVLMTAEKDSQLASLSDLIIEIPARTMADDGLEKHKSILPMGSLFEISQLIILDCVINEIISEKAIPYQEIINRHTNLE